MPDIAERILSLQTAVNTLTGKRDKAKWSVESIEREMLEKFNLTSIEEAEIEAVRAETEAEQAEAKLEAELSKVEAEYAQLLELANAD